MRYGGIRGNDGGRYGLYSSVLRAAATIIILLCEYAAVCKLSSSTIISYILQLCACTGGERQIAAFAAAMQLSTRERQTFETALRARFLATPSTPVLPPPAAAYAAPSPHDEWEPDEEEGAGDGWDLDDLEWPAENEELRDASVGNAAPTMPTMLPPTLPLGRSGGIRGGRGGGSTVRYMQGGAR